MVFDENDLKRLKEDCKNGVNDNGDAVDSFSLHIDFIQVLLARLEAAESVCGYVYGFPDYRDVTERQLLFEWRRAKGENDSKAAGKAGDER